MKHPGWVRHLGFLAPTPLRSVPCFLSCLSRNGPTARPFGTTLLAVNLSGLHSVPRVPFFPSDIVSVSIPNDVQL